MREIGLRKLYKKKKCKCWVKYNPALSKIWTDSAIGLFLTQRLGVKHLTKLLVENTITGFVHILPSTGLYLTHHFYSVNIKTRPLSGTVIKSQLFEPLRPKGSSRMWGSELTFELREEMNWAV